MIGVSVQKAILEEAVIEQRLDMESAKIDFLTFCLISSKFMTEEDEEGLKEELKEAFRIYDRDGQGFITTDVLKEILREIDSELTEDDLDNIIEEVDEDGSGTLDFDGEPDSMDDLSNKFTIDCMSNEITLTHF